MIGDYVYFDGGEMSQLLDGKHQKDVIGYDFSPGEKGAPSIPRHPTSFAAAAAPRGELMTWDVA